MVWKHESPSGHKDLRGKDVFAVFSVDDGILIDRFETENEAIAMIREYGDITSWEKPNEEKGNGKEDNKKA